MRTILFALLFAISGAQSLWAGEGDRILKSVRESYQEQPVWIVNFRHSFHWEMTGEDIVEEGRLMLSGAASFRVDLAGQHMLSDGELLWRWQDGGFQALLEPLGNSPDVILPQQLLVDLAEKFNAGKSKKTGKNQRSLSLIPKGDSEFMSDIRMQAEKLSGNWIIRELTFVDIQGNRHRYELLDRRAFGANSELPDSLANSFDFQLPPGVELIDLRN